MSDDPQWFPVMKGYDWDRKRPGVECPNRVPWGMLLPYEKQAMTNHSQTLRRLAERGGLCPEEMAGIMQGLRWRELGQNTPESAAAYLVAALEAYETPKARP